MPFEIIYKKLENVVEIAAKKKASALKRAIKAAKASRNPEPLRATLQKVTPQYIPPGHPLVAQAERLLQDIADESRNAAVIAALQAAIVEAKRTRAAIPLKRVLRAALDQRVPRDHPVMDEARQLLQLLEDEETARLYAEQQLLKSIGVAKRILSMDKLSIQSIIQAKQQLVSAKIKALKVCEKGWKHTITTYKHTNQRQNPSQKKQKHANMLTKKSLSTIRYPPFLLRKHYLSPG